MQTEWLQITLRKSDLRATLSVIFFKKKGFHLAYSADSVVLMSDCMDGEADLEQDCPCFGILPCRMTVCVHYEVHLTLLSTIDSLY